MEATLKHGSPIMVDYTPSGAAVDAGKVVVIGDAVFVAHDDIADGKKGALALCGGIYSLTAGEAIAAGKKVYWDDTNNKLVETATTGKLFGFLLPDSSASADGDTVLAVHMPDMSGSTPAAVVAALTDNSGGAAADGTIGAVTAPTALTDNGGGTADGTVVAMTAATALTVTDGAGTNDGTIGAITADASVIAAVQEIAAKIATVATFEAAAKDNFKELTTAQGQNRTAIVALTDAVTELSTKVNAILTALKNAGLMKTS